MLGYLLIVLIVVNCIAVGLTPSFFFGAFWKHLRYSSEIDRKNLQKYA